MRLLGIWVFVSLSLLVCSCFLASAAAQQGNEPSQTQNGAAATSDGVQHPIPAERNPRYRICREDVLLLSFPLSPELNQKVTVQPDGFISLLNAGNVYVAGLSLPELVGVVKKAYAGTLRDPIVDVDLADFQKPFFTVLGQVAKPGQYDLRYDMTVTQGIAVAGGFTDNGKPQIFLLRAVSSNWAEVRELKIKDVLSGKNISEDVHLRPGDMIFVPEKAIAKFKRYVPYSFALTPFYPPTL